MEATPYSADTTSSYSKVRVEEELKVSPEVWTPSKAHEWQRKGGLENGTGTPRASEGHFDLVKEATLSDSLTSPRLSASHAPASPRVAAAQPASLGFMSVPSPLGGSSTPVVPAATPVAGQTMLATITLPTVTPITPLPATPTAQYTSLAPEAGYASSVLGEKGVADEEALRLRRELDIRSSFVGLPKVTPQETHQYMKILVVGENGLGRTTFIKNLFAPYAGDPNFPVKDASGPNARDTFENNPRDLLSGYAIFDNQARVWYHYLVQDTPGYGDSMDLEGDRQLVLDYVRGHNKNYYEQERSEGRSKPIHKFEDGRVDVCLYFIPPHRLRKLDVEFMRELSQLVPVVPILSKADTMTPEELKDFRQKVRKACDKAGVLSFRFSQEALESASARGPPYAVVSSNTMDLSVGRFWPVRRYPWGNCEALLSTHSDLPALRRLLLETGYWDLKEATERRYHDYRRRRAEDEAAKPLKSVRAIARLAAATAVVGLVGYVALHGVPAEIKDEVKRRETVRRVKLKLGEKADEVASNLQETLSSVQERVVNGGHITRTVAQVSAEKAAAAAEENRKKQEAEERGIYKRRDWWKFWGE